MAEKSAVYFQRSKAVHEEFRLIEAATSREVIVGKLQKIIKSVKEKRLEMVDEVILETFQLLNELREVTMRLIKAIKAWQDSFTRPVRPTIYNCDYIIDRMIKHVDFINGSKVRKIFNFQFYRGNPLLLPYPNLKTGDPIKVHAALAKEIRTFANPNEDDVIECYQFLLNCLPPEIYNEKLVSMQKWLVEPWVPRIFATSNTTVPCFPSSKQQVQMNLQKEFGNRTSGGGETPGGNRAPSPANLRDRRNSATSQTSKSSASSGHPPVGRPQPLPTVAAPAGRRRLGAQPIAETSQAGKAKGTTSPIAARTRSTSNDGGDSTDPLLSAMGDMSPPARNNAANNNAQRMKMRRNMMVHRDQQQAMAVITGDADLISVASDGTPLSQTSETPKLTEAQQAQVQQLDLYYQELEGMFLPKFGRRAVQTMVAGGERRSPSSPTGADDDEDDPHGHGNQQEFQYRTKRAFSMFTSKAFEKRLDDAEQAIRTENFIRTDAQLIQKRNRILEQRGKNDAEYRTNTNANNGSPVRLQASPSGKSLGSIPEQATTPTGGGSRRARTRSGDGTENGEDEDDGEGDEEDDDYGEDDYGDDGDDGGDDDGDGGDDRDAGGNGNGNGEAPCALSRSSSLVKRPRSRQTSSVSFALRVESSADQVKNGLRPPKIQIPHNANAVSRGPRPRLESQESGNSSTMNAAAASKATPAARSHRRERTQSTGSDSNAGSAVSPLPQGRRGMDKQDSASSFAGAAAAATMSRTSSGSSLRVSRRPDSSHSNDGRRPRSRSRSKSPQHGSRRGGSQPGSPTAGSPSGRSPIQLSTARMRQWYVDNARREAALQRQQMLAGKLP